MDKLINNIETHKHISEWVRIQTSITISSQTILIFLSIELEHVDKCSVLQKCYMRGYLMVSKFSLPNIKFV